MITKTFYKFDKKMKIKNSGGYTILELMIVIAMVGVLLSIAVPSYQDFLKDKCLTTNANLLVTSFQQARSEAVKRSANVKITREGSSDWSDGWTISKAPHDDANILRIVNTTCPMTILEQTSRIEFTYGSDGFIDATGELKLCDAREAETGRTITLSIIGRPSTDRHECL
ncbi:MAG: hypothetical protein CMF45_06405 [Legionellales bacterium]|nr:hypothetical protein [Legionellales bacterium]|tara:strand:+ start:558 stop:1067 length:510 start_codon:yes stop_codon:yes gene_type:complete